MIESTESEAMQADTTTITNTSPRKDWWDKLRVIGGAAIPIVLAVLGWQVNVTLKERELNAQYVNLAINILQSADSSEATQQLRLWALDIFAMHSPVAMPEGLRAAIEKGQVQLPNSDDPSSVRLDLLFDSDMIAVLDGTRRMGPGAGRWITRVSPGAHTIQWLGPDSSQLCIYETTSEAVDLRLSCDRRTGEVTVRKGLP
jgi:hypothetical protein